MKNRILFNAGVLVLVASFAQRGVCQNQTARPGLSSLSNCIHGHEAASEVPGLIIEQIVVAPGWGKDTNPKIGADSDEVQKLRVVVNGRVLTVIAGHADDKSCILREDWGNTQASVGNER